jgi:hypothetical protein
MHTTGSFQVPRKLRIILSLADFDWRWSYDIWVLVAGMEFLLVSREGLVSVGISSMSALAEFFQFGKVDFSCFLTIMMDLFRLLFRVGLCGT